MYGIRIMHAWWHGGVRVRRLSGFMWCRQCEMASSLFFNGIYKEITGICSEFCVVVSIVHSSDVTAAERCGVSTNMERRQRGIS
jgi:hypothetical protein